MSAAHDQTAPGGTLSTESKPQVVVRAGKYFICTACRTLVEVPPDVVGQLVTTAHTEPTAPVAPAAPEEPRPQPTAPEDSRPKVLTPAPSSGKTSPRAPRQKKRFRGEIIDGLRVPSSRQLDRALGWVTFQLKVLDRQGSELHHLQKRHQKRVSQQVPSPRPRGHAEAEHNAPTTSNKESVRHAHEDVSMAPKQDPPQDRGPPS
ncbi:hypothetical protein AB1K70_24720 [Bremerella sp. JC770]|uniref:hypothetical protein n=1 Tax=Bremerella sp. JC770 TaxID=3232137 RepID=UPI0034593AA5